MGCGCCRLALAIIAALWLLAAVAPQLAQAQGVVPLSLRDTAPSAVVKITRYGPWFHAHRTQSFYCYPRNYWWFYRPYTTAQEDFPRCEPYFHYLEPSYGRRGAWSGGYLK
jgi:hypothetical protein